MAAVVWFGICLGLAVVMSRWVSKRIWKALVIVVVTPSLLVAPFVTRIIGRPQFERYCKGAEVSILGVVPAPKELYSSTGEWRLSMKWNLLDNTQFAEHNKLVHIADSMVRWDSSETRSISKLIGERRTRIYEKGTNRLLAEWSSYTYVGGFAAVIGGWKNAIPNSFARKGMVCTSEYLRTNSKESLPSSNMAVLADAAASTARNQLLHTPRHKPLR